MFSTTFAAFVRRSRMPPLRFHDLRHSHATHLLRAGVHPDTYSHMLPGMQEDAVRLIDVALAEAMKKHKADKT